MAAETGSGGGARISRAAEALGGRYAMLMAVQVAAYLLVVVYVYPQHNTWLSIGATVAFVVALVATCRWYARTRRASSRGWPRRYSIAFAVTAGLFGAGIALLDFAANRDRWLWVPYAGTDPVLSKQVEVLENAGYVAAKKGYVGKRPRTWLSLTDDGRGALARHLTDLHASSRTSKPILLPSRGRDVAPSGESLPPRVLCVASAAGTRCGRCLRRPERGSGAESRSWAGIAPLHDHETSVDYLGGRGVTRPWAVQSGAAAGGSLT